MINKSLNSTLQSSLISPTRKGISLGFLILCALIPFLMEAKKVKYSDGTVIYSLDTSTRKATVTGVEEGSSSRKITIIDYILNSDDGKTYTVNAIAKEAFMGSFLENVTLPSTIETIGSRAFETCSLKKLELPANLKTVGAYAFYDAFYSKNPIELVIPSGCTAIKGFAFNGCSIRSIRFNSKLTTLGEYSFANTDLTEVEVPASVTSLGDGVFASCLKLTKASIKGNRTTLPYQFFDGCSALTDVSLPSTITSFGQWAFANCTALKSLTLPASLKSVGDMGFYKSGLASISLPNGIQTLGDHAFAYMPNLTQITIPASMTSIADYCFDGSEALMNVTALNPVPCHLGTCGFDSATYSNATLNIPAGSERAYQLDREWSCFHYLFDLETGVEDISVTQTNSLIRRLILTEEGPVIELNDGNSTIRYDLHGKRMD